MQIIVLYVNTLCLETSFHFSLLFVFQRIPLQRLSEEFKEIEALFCKTMRGYDMVKIERIQNKSLWEVFQW